MRLAMSSIVLFCIPSIVSAAELSPAERGKIALLQTSFIPPIWRLPAYEKAWQSWEGVKQKPAKYDEAFRDRYGLHVAPYENGRLPMGLRKSNYLFVQGISVDCLACHGGSIGGTSYIGLGNSTLDVQALFEEMSRADGRSPKLPFTFCNVRGTSEAGGMGVYLLGFRDPDLAMHKPRKELGLHDDLCEDVPAWWLLKKKKTMYFTGGADAHSVRSKMQFMMTPLTTKEDFSRHEDAFKDINEFLMSIEPPKYPLSIDRALAGRGEKLFLKNCSSCHGTYGVDWTYPNKIVPMDEIGTDPRRYAGITEAFAEYYNQTWFAKEKVGWFKSGYEISPSRGYQAPPLDGIWATAPYLHNGSVPTLYHLLNSKERPSLFTRSYKTGFDDYDPVKVGWKFRRPSDRLGPGVPAVERRKFYDTTQPGRSNSGHTFGDQLTDEERFAVIEYLKTL